MTKAEIDAVFDRVKTWPPERQEEVAAMLLEIEAEVTGVYHLTEEERREIDLSMEEARAENLPLTKKWPRSSIAIAPNEGSLYATLARQC